ncbi:MAG: hypothetical protein ACLS9K_12690 [Lachnospira eligens]
MGVYLLGLGTILSMIGVGRVITVFNKLFNEHMETVGLCGRISKRLELGLKTTG